ncbi:MAG: phosphodiester glycosidase family protein [Bacilli bacterium]|nr:phosphodiester glycosidase family protein [Bacilli bacterium]
MKHFIKSLFSLVLIINLLVVLTVSAKPTVNFESETIKSYTDIVSTDVYGVATINQTTITSYNKRVIVEGKLADHNSYWLEPNVSLTDSDLRVVNYTSGSATNWDGVKPTDLAKIYEQENPGWIVVGGTNGDFFWITDNCEIQGTSMQEGDFYKPYDYNVGEHMAIGFRDDGTYVYGIVDASDKQYVQVLGEDGKYTDVAMINDVDDTPTATGVTLLTRFTTCPSPYKDTEYVGTLPYDLTGYTVYKVKYDVQRFDRDGSAKVGEHRVFVKGTVTEIVNDVKTLEIDDKEQLSYLVTKDDSLSTLKVGDQVRCQCKLEGEWEGVTNITSAYNQVLKNGEVIDYNLPHDCDSGYINAIKNRTIMGFKADGTPIMMVVEKGSYGASYEECGEILKGLGCVEGFLFDGGGSSCIFVRDNSGGFVTLNRHEDGRERSDGNAVFFVKRDPGFNIMVNDIERFSASVKLDITNQDYFNELSNIKITLNGVTKDYDPEGVKFEGLEEDTEYSVNVSYDIEKLPDSGDIVNSSHAKQFKTRAFSAPKHGLSIVNITHNSFTVKKNTELETASWIQDVVIHVGRTTYNMGNKSEIVCDELDKNTEYEVYYEYTVVDPDSGKEYPFSTNPTYIYTLPFCVPSVLKLEETRKGTSSLSLEYEYLDDDKVVTKAYIMVNGKVSKELSIKYGKVTLTGLDFDENEYIIKLVLEYVDDNENTIIIESNELVYAKEHVHNFVDGICECGETDPNYVPPHVHEFVEGKCECGEIDPNYVPPHVHEYVEGKCECGEIDPNYVEPHTHTFVEGKCECGEIDPTYVAPGDSEPEPAKKKCGNKSAELVISILSLTAVIGLFFRKRK